MQISLVLIEKVNQVLALYPASVTRVCTTPYRNEAIVKGAPASKHLTGEAVDLVFDQSSTLLYAAKYARELGFGGIEVNYSNNHLHLDIRSVPFWHEVRLAGKKYTLQEYLTKLENGSIINFSI
jgi:uncharacterized protein YcbK (DUF882 family)